MRDHRRRNGLDMCRFRRLQCALHDVRERAFLRDMHRRSPLDELDGHRVRFDRSCAGRSRGVCEAAEQRADSRAGRRC